MNGTQHKWGRPDDVIRRREKIGYSLKWRETAQALWVIGKLATHITLATVPVLFFLTALFHVAGTDVEMCKSFNLKKTLYESWRVARDNLRNTPTRGLPTRGLDKSRIGQLADPTVDFASLHA